MDAATGPRSATASINADSSLGGTLVQPLNDTTREAEFADLCDKDKVEGMRFESPT